MDRVLMQFWHDWSKVKGLVGLLVANMFVRPTLPGICIRRRGKMRQGLSGAHGGWRPGGVSESRSLSNVVTKSLSFGKSSTLTTVQPYTNTTTS